MENFKGGRVVCQFQSIKKYATSEIFASALTVALLPGFGRSGARSDANRNEWQPCAVHQNAIGPDQGLRSRSTNALLSASGAGVARLTTTSVRNPAGMPNTPAEIGAIWNQALASEPPSTGLVCIM